MSTAVIAPTDALAILQRVFADPVHVTVVPEEWWGEPEFTLQLTFRPTDEPGWSDLELRVVGGISSQRVRLIPAGCDVSPARYRAFAEGLRDAMPALFKEMRTDDPSRLFLGELLLRRELDTREAFAAAVAAS